MSDGMAQGPTVPTTGYLEESPGVRSSKRFWGTVLLALGALILACVAVASIGWGRNDTSAAISAGVTLMITGGGLLGFTVLEGLGESIGRIIGNRSGGAS